MRRFVGLLALTVVSYGCEPEVHHADQATRKKLAEMDAVTDKNAPQVDRSAGLSEVPPQNIVPKTHSSQPPSSPAGADHAIASSPDSKPIDSIVPVAFVREMLSDARQIPIDSIGTARCFNSAMTAYHLDLAGMDVEADELFQSILNDVGKTALPSPRLQALAILAQFSAVCAREHFYRSALEEAEKIFSLLQASQREIADDSRGRFVYALANAGRMKDAMQMAADTQDVAARRFHFALAARRLAAMGRPDDARSFLVKYQELIDPGIRRPAESADWIAASAWAEMDDVGEARRMVRKSWTPLGPLEIQRTKQRGSVERAYLGHLVSLAAAESRADRREGVDEIFSQLRAASDGDLRAEVVASIRCGRIDKVRELLEQQVGTARMELTGLACRAVFDAGPSSTAEELAAVAKNVSLEDDPAEPFSPLFGLRAGKFLKCLLGKNDQVLQEIAAVRAPWSRNVDRNMYASYLVKREKISTHEIVPLYEQTTSELEFFRYGP